MRISDWSSDVCSSDLVSARLLLRSSAITAVSATRPCQPSSTKSGADVTLKARITEDMKTAMRAKDSARLGTIRLLLAGIKQREVDEIGRASCRERVCQYVEISVVAV